MATQPHNSNNVLETSISITNIYTASQTAQHILSLGPSAAHITKIHISTDFSASESKFTEEHVQSLVQPITQILTALSSCTSSLTHFTWLAPCSTSTRFTRGSAFWSALYAHATTLQSLHLEFFEHEVHTLSAPPPSFPALRTLVLDTSSAHGDTGTCIHELLRACPELTALKFEWPACDLETCQIQNVEWDAYAFAHLKSLEVHGWDFAPGPFASFLARHAGVESLVDGVDGPYVEDGAEHVRLGRHVLPQLKKLWKRRGDARRLEEYFDGQAKRPISRLVLDIGGYGGAATLAELCSCEDTSRLETLELRGPSRAWRCVQWESDSSEDESAKQARKTKEAELPAIFLALPTLLEKLVALRELAIELDSTSYSSLNSKTGEFENDAEPDQHDLLRILAHVPRTTGLRSLRLGDENVGELDEGLVQDMQGVPDGLEILACGKEVFGIERSEGRVKGVRRENEVWKGWDEKWGMESM